MEHNNFLEKKYDIIINKDAVGQSKIEACNKIAYEIVDACNNSSTDVSYIVCGSTIIPTLSLSGHFERFDRMPIYGPYIAGKLDDTSVICSPLVICSPFAGEGEFFLCHGDGDKNLPVTSQEDFMARFGQITEQFAKETIAKGIIL